MNHRTVAHTNSPAHETKSRAWIWWVSGGVAILLIVAVIALGVGLLTGAALGAAGARGDLNLSATELPFDVTYRAAEFGPGLVLQVKNNSSRHLTIRLRHWNPTLNQDHQTSFDIGPGQLRELGWAEGIKLASGDTITLSHAEYRSFVWKVP